MNEPITPDSLLGDYVGDLLRRRPIQLHTTNRGWVATPSSYGEIIDRYTSTGGKLQDMGDGMFSFTNSSLIFRVRKP